MAADQPTKWSIFCVVVDENSPFSIKIQPDATVDDLKDSIKAKNQPEFDGFAANRLTLFKVDVPAQDMGEARQQIAALGLPSMGIMNAVFELRDYYSEPPPKKTIHILVQSPNTCN
jgi:Crinkler effector protein N-terminal domain